MIAGDVIPLTIEKPAAGGPMIARVEGLVVLVTGGIPGERVRARIERVTKSVAYGVTVDIDEASPDRRAAGGDPLCGGCLYAHIAYPRQLELKRAVIEDAFARIGHLPLPEGLSVAPSPEDGYRMRARLHVRGGRIGFFREGTHDLCNARQTRQLLPATCDVLERLGASMASPGPAEIDLSENVDASERVIAVDGVHGEGSPYVVDRLTLGGSVVSFRRHVLAFFQGNRFLLRDLVSHVVAQTPSEGEVVDLYAGVGLFSISAARASGVRVTAVEGDRVAAADLDSNAAASGASVAAVHDSVEGYMQRTRPDRPSAAIVDPPRTGLSREALDGAVALGAPRLIYVSCDVATLARDARRIVDAGFRIARADAFDLFPNTPHVETVVVFDR
jgi:23S rRNA (uracil1939-C5)-methyltransferase